MSGLEFVRRGEWGGPQGRRWGWIVTLDWEVGGEGRLLRAIFDEIRGIRAGVPSVR